MAKVTIRLHSDVEEEGRALVNALQRIADAHEGYCSHLFGDPDQLKLHHREIMKEISKLLSIAIEMGVLADKICDL